MTGHPLTFYADSGASEFGITEDQFAQMLADVSAAAGRSGTDVQGFYACLKLQDLVLARACVAGNERAWNVLVERYRHKLFSMALQIAKEESTARDLADSLFAELFGMRKKADGDRVSKLSYYTGRAALDTWMRAVLAQTYLDRCRTSRRFVPLETIDAFAERGPEYANNDPFLAQALDAALQQLNPEQRFFLAAHYLDGRSKAEIGRICALHETTVGRRIEKALKLVRDRTIRQLQQHGMSRAQAMEALNCDVGALEIDIRNRLLATRQA